MRGNSGIPPKYGAGFTLLEVLVVLLIIGISIGFITLAIPTDRDDLRREAERLAVLVRLALDEAVLQSTEYALGVFPDRYEFLELRGEAFEVLAEDELLRPRSLPERTEVELFLEGEPVELVKDDQGLGEGATPPRIYFLSSGELTPFVIILGERDGDLRYTVSGDPLGRVSSGRSEP